MACFWGLLAALLVATTAAAQETEALPDLATDIADLGPTADANAQATEALPPIIEPTSSTQGLRDVLVYAGVDGWQFGGSAYVGSDWTFPISGMAIVPVVRLFAANGIDDFKTRFASFKTDTARASIMPGIQFREGSLDIKLFAGGDFERRMPLNGASASTAQFFGGRVAADIWWEPAPDWMLSGSASATTIEEGRSARLAAGWRLPLAWFGPEVQAVHDVFNTQYRAGAHLTGLKLGVTEWSLAGGYVRDSFGRSGPYARIGVSFRP